MHPEVASDKPGRCPKCGMQLVPKDEVQTHAVDHSTEDMGLGKTTWKSYIPLLVIVGLILLTSLTISYKQSFEGSPRGIQLL